MSSTTTPVGGQVSRFFQSLIGGAQMVVSKPCILYQLVQHRSPKGKMGREKLEVEISIMEVWRMKIQSIMFGVELVLIFFSNDRMGSLDGYLLSKMGLTTERMVLDDSLFFYQLLLPICDPTCSGITGVSRKQFFSKVKKITYLYAYSIGLGG